MARPIIQPGRVQSDPMNIPTAASMRRPDADHFDRVLQEASRQQQDTPVETRPRTSEEPYDADSVAQTAPEQAAVEPIDAERPVADADATDVAAAHPQNTPVESADVNEHIRRGGTEQSHKAAGKGTASPRRTSSAEGPLPSHDALHAAAADGSATPFVPGQAAANSPAANTTTRSIEPTIRGAQGAALGDSGPARARAAQAGYGTRSAATLQMMERARDSVFKQILMKLTDDGGDMRMTLQPPELGELDLRLTVEGGNRLTLAIAAERADMNQLLQRHLDELKQTLQASGLEIGGAEVQTREEFARRNQQREQAATQHDNSRTHDGADESAPTRGRTGGYIHADGLDFWA